MRREPHRQRRSKQYLPKDNRKSSIWKSCSLHKWWCDWAFRNSINLCSEWIQCKSSSGFMQLQAILYTSFELFNTALRKPECVIRKQTGTPLSHISPIRFRSDEKSKTTGEKCIFYRESSINIHFKPTSSSKF